MTNRHAPTVREYHERTKLHPGASDAPRRVDASLIPRQYKRYVDLPAVHLPVPAPTGRPLFDVLARAGESAQPLTLAVLASVLHYSAGIVRRRYQQGREPAFRAASCTGALYHVELYVVCGDIEGLPAGVYHYDVPAACLRELRRGDYRVALADASSDDGIAGAAASIVLTSTFWRNAWRYEERAYRHVFWDAGTLLANLLAVGESHLLQPALYSAFVDADVNALLGVDAKREAAVAVVSLGAGKHSAASPAHTPVDHRTERLSRAEIEYPLIWQTHAATSLLDAGEVLAWRLRAASQAPAFKATLVPQGALSLERAVERRRSARRFSDRPMALDAFQTVLAAAQGSTRSDHTVAQALCRPYLIVNRVEGLAAGVYGIDAHGAPEMQSPGDFAAEASRLALDQPAAGNAAVDLYFIADIDEVTAKLGGRGYRAVQLEAGIRTGQVYLAATALGLRATGLTFYDDEVATFLGLKPAETAVLMLAVFGP